MKYKKAKAVVRCCGGYCAWHEMGIYIDYILGDYDDLPDCFEEEVNEWLNSKGYEYGNNPKLTKQHKQELDSFIIELVENFKGDYSDYCIGDVLLEISESGKIYNTYLSI